MYFHLDKILFLQYVKYKILEWIPATYTVLLHNIVSIIFNNNYLLLSFTQSCIRIIHICE